MFFFIFLILLFPFSTYQVCTSSDSQVRVNPITLADNQWMALKSFPNGNFVTAFYSNSYSGIRLKLFDSSGNNITDEFGIPGGNRPSIAVTSNTFIVCYPSSNVPYFSVFSHSGASISGPTSIFASTGDFVKCTELTRGGFVICFAQGSAIECGKYNNTGYLMISSSVKSVSNINTGHRFCLGSLRGGGFVLGYVVSQYVRGRVFDASLNAITPTEFAFHSLNIENNQYFSISGISDGGFVFTYYSSSNFYFKGIKEDGTALFTESTGASSLYCPSIAQHATGGFIIASSASSGTYLFLYTNSGSNKLYNGAAGAGKPMNDDSTIAFLDNYKVACLTYYNNEVWVQIITLSNCASDIYDSNSILTWPIPSTSLVSNSGGGGSGFNQMNNSNFTNTSNLTQGNISNSSQGGNGPITPTPNLFYPSNDSNSTNTTLAVTKYIPPAALKGVTTGAAAVMGTAVSTSFLSGVNPTLLWGILGFLQEFFYLLFLNVNTPGNLKTFLQVFEFANLDFIPDVTKVMDLPNLSSPPKFYENNFTGLFIKNMGSNIQLWIIVASITIFLAFMRRQSYLSVKIKIILLKSCPTRMWIESISPFLISICLQFSYFGFYEPSIGISTLIGTILIAMIGVTPILFAWAIKYEKRKSYIFHPLFQDFDMTENKKKYFPVFEVLKKIFGCLIIVYLYDYPLQQVILLAIINILYFLLMVFIQPRKSKKLNIYYLILEFFSMVIHLSFTSFYYDIEDDTRDNLGYFIIALIVICIIMTVVPMFYEQGISLCRLKKRAYHQKRKTILRHNTKMKYLHSTQNVSIDKNLNKTKKKVRITINQTEGSEKDTKYQNKPEQISKKVSPIPMLSTEEVIENKTLEQSEVHTNYESLRKNYQPSSTNYNTEIEISPYPIEFNLYMFNAIKRSKPILNSKSENSNKFLKNEDDNRLQLSKKSEKRKNMILANF